MLETTFTTKFEQGPIPAGFHIHLEGDLIVLIGRNGSGKTSLLNVLFRKNVGERFDQKTHVCLISTTSNLNTTVQPSGRTLEQYNIELAKVIGENNGRGHGRPNPDELPKLLLDHNNFTAQIQKLNSYLSYLDLPKCEIQGSRDTFVEQLQTIFRGSGLQSIFAILAALTNDSIKMVLIDEPELYLHPKLQKQLSELLYFVSKEKQIIIATHSNVFINRKDYKANYFISKDTNQFCISRASSESQLEGISPAEVKLAKALAKAVPSIIPDLLTSLDIEELYVGKPEDTNQATKIVQEKREEINITVFYEELKESIKHNKDGLATRHRERVLQTNIAYYVSLICLILGVLLVFTGVILIFIGKLEGGLLTTVSSVISSIVSGLAFIFNKQANDLEREDSKQMRTLEKSYEAMGYISCLTDEKKRDELIEKLVERHFFGN
jgi:ABC-type lipoprotein export system ATPase subunit